jgi:hypothetical protein
MRDAPKGLDMRHGLEHASYEQGITLIRLNLIRRLFSEELQKKNLEILGKADANRKSLLIQVLDLASVQLNDTVHVQQRGEDITKCSAYSGKRSKGLRALYLHRLLVLLQTIPERELTVGLSFCIV